jgi:GxxExxY protein
MTEDTGQHGAAEQRSFTEAKNSYLWLLRLRRIRARQRLSFKSAHFTAGARLADRLCMLIETEVNPITHQILSAAIEVHRTLGPGLLESTYTPCLLYELHARNLRYVAQRAIPLVYKGIDLGNNYCVGLIVEDVFVVEVKSVEAVMPVHRAQTLTYMRLTNTPAGLVINFNVPRLMDGVRRLLLKDRFAAQPEETSERRSSEERS